MSGKEDCAVLGSRLEAQRNSVVPGTRDIVYEGSQGLGGSVPLDPWTSPSKGKHSL